MAKGQSKGNDGKKKKQSKAKSAKKDAAVSSKNSK